MCILQLPWACKHFPPKCAQISSLACVQSDPYRSQHAVDGFTQQHSLCAAFNALGVLTGFTFDDIPGDGIRIPRGYQGLIWDNWFMLDGDSYQVQNGYYAGEALVLDTWLDESWQHIWICCCASAPIVGRVELYAHTATPQANKHCKHMLARWAARPAVASMFTEQGSRPCTGLRWHSGCAVTAASSKSSIPKRLSVFAILMQASLAHQRWLSMATGIKPLSQPQRMVC